jgi:hypothetical protein
MGNATGAHDSSVANYRATRRFWPLRGQNANPRLRAGRKVTLGMAIGACSGG